MGNNLLVQKVGTFPLLENDDLIKVLVCFCPRYYLLDCAPEAEQVMFKTGEGLKIGYEVDAQDFDHNWFEVRRCTNKIIKVIMI